MIPSIPVDTPDCLRSVHMIEQDPCDDAPPLVTYSCGHQAHVFGLTMADLIRNRHALRFCSQCCNELAVNAFSD